MRKAFVPLALVFCCGSALAEVRLPNIYSEHGVLQRDTPIHLWGFAAPDETIQVDFHDQHLKTVATTQGLWSTYLLPEKAGGPYVLKVSGSATKEPVKRNDILVGDLWFASGQSNMEMPLQGWDGAPIKDSAKEIHDADYPTMRLLIQTRRPSIVPMLDTDNTWQVCKPETARRFSAVAFFFGRKIMQEEKVPIGLIDATWGGTPAHSWISAEGIAWANLSSVASDGARLVREQGQADAIRENYKFQDAIVQAAGQKPPTHARVYTDRADAWIPSALFNGMIAPFTSLNIRGWLWYQGEADTDHSHTGNYSHVFPALISDWRRQWGQGNLPFFFAQLSSFDQPTNDWGCVRDAQRRALDVTGTGMAVTLDLGESHNIHPAHKQEVGNRLAQSALALAYHHGDVPSSPAYSRVSTEEHALRVWLSDAKRLSYTGDKLDGFEIAGSDGVFSPAMAKIEPLAGESTILLTSPTVASPMSVRYGWTSYVPHYLVNETGLPLGTFTSESTCR